MSKQEFDDETLMAFADGELDETTAARLEAAMEADETLAIRLAEFLESRIAVASALKPLIDEPVPDALRASVQRMASGARQPENVVSFGQQRKPKPQARQAWLMPIAASIVAVAAGIGGFMLGRDIGSTAPAGGNAALAALLDREASGRDVALGTTGDTVQIISTFRSEQGDLCREYDLKQQGASTVSISCRENGGWVTHLALSAPRTEGYTPASAQETIDAYLASIHADAPMSAEEERAALSALR